MNRKSAIRLTSRIIFYSIGTDIIDSRNGSTELGQTSSSHTWRQRTPDQAAQRTWFDLLF